MRKTLAILTIVLLVLFMVGCENSVNPIKSQTSNDNEGISLAKKGGDDVCATITGGDVYYSSTHYLTGELIPTGYDVYGYNYQAHLYKGNYVNVYLGGYGYPPYDGDDVAYLAENPTAEALWCWPYRMYEIQMKWNDAWLANKDCDGDGKLDRTTPRIGSGAWEMYSEKMGGPDGYTYKCKIVAVPADATLIASVWYNIDGVEIGPVIWGSYAIIQEVQGGSGVTEHGLLYAGDDHLGLGGW